MVYDTRATRVLKVYLLDTNHCSRITLGYCRPPSVAEVEIPDRHQSIVRGELMFMAQNSEQR